MSDQGDKTCPLCAEEMDLTDQQLKPCKCGYEICVWCWHHIMDMAEKDASEGRCPACRTPYDKEKIVGTGPNERLVSEINERKKSQKSKTKPSEGRKQLSSVRVIQRNLVYIVGLPLNFADEDLLQRREYFGQYGKVLKVSMSRTATGVVQQFPNNTCSVYITYGKEDEAIRCIQSVHGFVLDGRSLKACFGTTKYCHAWLRNMPCTNSDCLYLHEVGSQEDSFTKDEIMSAYTRVQQITGATSNLARRSGSMLPPPPLDYSYDSSASALMKGSTNPSTVGFSCKGSPPNGSSSRSAALPAAASWGTRASNQPPSITSKPKPMADTVASTVGFPVAVTTTIQSSAAVGDIKAAWDEDGQSINSKAKPDLMRPSKQHDRGDSRPIMSEKASINDSGDSTELPKDWETVDETRSTLYPETSSVRKTDSGARSETSMAMTRSSSMFPENSAVKSPKGQKHVDQYGQSLASTACKPAANGLSVSREVKDSKMNPQTRAVSSSVCELEKDLVSFDNQRLSDPEVVSRTSYFPSTVNSVQAADDSWPIPSQHSDALDVKGDPLFLDSRNGDRLMRNMSCDSIMGNGYPEKLTNNISTMLDRTGEHKLLPPVQGEGKHWGILQCESDGNGNAAPDTRENSIISDILSLDLDSWDESLTSPQHLAKLLGNTGTQTSSLKMSNSWKAQNKKQSKFSFARQEESMNHEFDVDNSLIGLGQMPRNHPFNHDLLENRNAYMDKHGPSNGFSTSIVDESNNFMGFPSSNFPGPRAQISAPPGFTVPNRAPPPGFSSHERTDHTFGSMLGSQLLDTPSLHRSSYHAPPMAGSMTDIELIDPAILAVGKGRFQGGLNNNSNHPGLDLRSNFQQQLGMFENEARLQILMQRSQTQQQHQNIRYGADHGNSFSTGPESYGISSRMADQLQMNGNQSAFAKLSQSQSRNGHWDNHNSSWNEVAGGNSMGMAELLRNERLGLNKFYTAGYEDSKYQMPSSGDLYNRTFEM
ncbi:CCR4-NOT transcription complex subunit 4 [Linum grandiflorum]